MSTTEGQTCAKITDLEDQPQTICFPEDCLGELALVKPLGFGTGTAVYEAVDIKTGHTYAVKLNILYNESKIYRKASELGLAPHLHYIKECPGQWQSSDAYGWADKLTFLVFDKMDFMLEQALAQPWFPKWQTYILDAIQNLNEAFLRNSIIYVDWRAQNILLNAPIDDQPPEIKVIDYEDAFNLNSIGLASGGPSIEVRQEQEAMYRKQFMNWFTWFKQTLQTDIPETGERKN